MDVRIFLIGMLVEFLGIALLATGYLAENPAGILAGGLLLAASVAAQVIHVIRQVSGHENRKEAGSPAAGLAQGTLYADRLVTLTGDTITFHHYMLPLFSSSRTVPYQDIVRIEIRRPTVLSGKWRIGGSGDCRTWFPFDWDRPSRDRIFRAIVRTRGMNIGFTVEDSAKVAALFRSRGIPVTEES